MKQQQDISMLAERIRAILIDRNTSEKRMFGGITFLVNGNMLCCAFKQGLMLRVGKEGRSGGTVRPLSSTRKMPGFVLSSQTALLTRRHYRIGSP